MEIINSESGNSEIHVLGVDLMTRGKKLHFVF